MLAQSELAADSVLADCLTTMSEENNNITMGKETDLRSSILVHGVNEKVLSSKSNQKSTKLPMTGDKIQGNAEDANCGCSDVQSEDSNDSGKGGSEVFGDSPSAVAMFSPIESRVLIYQFVMPSAYCGRLIGKAGNYVHLIKHESNANVVVSDHPQFPETSICTVEGNRPNDIRVALHLIRQRFPARVYPEITLNQVNLITPLDAHNCTVALSHSCRLPLPLNVSSDVLLSCLISPGHFFLQQPTHPTYFQLQMLDMYMATSYSNVTAPGVPRPSVGIVVAVPSVHGWHRALVVSVNDEECEVKFLDYGGFWKVPVAALKQIRIDFMYLPFQATECFLADIKPVNDEGWSTEASQYFEEQAQGQILQAVATSCSPDETCHVRLYKYQNGATVYINEDLVKRGFAQWTESSDKTKTVNRK
ncbi:A-kinase anchor protein 1, mitochondrial [Halotydeus destructor]|nr:A-kinase anchor protein 1, mitochondrial [Halotydeus destructor]